ncbi:cell surface glycoprotein CD200 receptor 1-A-like [Falco naumanni]|uniref:cell surface glycoprotein CD200 receptor 1-A-like n=1 Tax=Falco naumanni TaxID=148594 RepID=UPI001ADE3191|nr:cell surface glycoprotein CD200 receptor 1-A-like [Falco naumanni]
MKAGGDMKIAGKAVCVFVLFTIKVMSTVGNLEVSAMVGSTSVLTCTPRPNTTMIIWKMSPKVGGPCTLGYRADHHKTDRTNCSDSINWRSRPDWDPALEIRQVGIAHEGNYTCEVVATEGNFHEMYHLTVLVPPRLTVRCDDDDGRPVCEAGAGRPAAQIWWVPESNSPPREEAHDNGTVTVLSKFAAYSTNVTNATCFMSHPVWNQSMDVGCPPPENMNLTRLYVSIILCFLSIIPFVAVMYYFKLHIDRLCHKTKTPETAPTDSPQEDTMEVEPYTIYVQKENVIYNSVSDLTAGQNLPQGLSPAT